MFDRRIRDNEYEFPTDRVISIAVQQLIQQILTPTPSLRPTLHEIVDHLFFTQGPVPSYIPTSAHDSAPDFRHISKTVSDGNLRRLRKYALLDIDQNAIPPSGMPASMSSGGLSASKSITNSIAQQEKEFQKAVQPGSPISALLSSARQPLLMGMGASGTGPARESPLLRKLQAVKESPLGRTVTRGLDGIIEENEPQGKRRVEEEAQQDELRLRKKELEAQKARIVAQMAPVKEEQEEPEYDEHDEMVKPREKYRDRYEAMDDRENLPPVPTTTTVPQKREYRVKEEKAREARVEKENKQATG
jgi:cell cycle serine/threonine-protein kinase CDC5/MSD2